MPGVDRSIICHRLSIDSKIKPVRQKPRKMNAEWCQALSEEVDRLLKPTSLERYYLDWLTNLVLVKKNGKWRVCINFTNLNQACPKDSSPFPRID